MALRSIIRPLFAGLCLVATALGLNNTYGDDTEVRALGERTACGSSNCSVKLLREDRSAFKHSFGFQTRLLERGKSPGAASVDVECRRSLYLFGDYACAVTSGGLPPS